MGRPTSVALCGGVLCILLCHSIFRYGKYAKSAETQAIKGGFFTSAVMGTLFFLGLGMFGIAFWYVCFIQILTNVWFAY